MTFKVDLRPLRGHELAFLIHIMTDASTSLLTAFPPLGFELLEVLQNELYGRADGKLGEWQVSMTFDYEADKVLLQAQAAGRWCDEVMKKTRDGAGFENVTGLLESLRSQLGAGVADLLERRRVLESLNNGQD